MIDYKSYLNRISVYSTETSEKTGINKNFLKVDCFWNCVLGRSTIRDYFIYKFFYLNRKGKKEYISNTEMVDWNIQNSRKDHMGILDDKEKALVFFKEYVDRDWCSINAHNTIEEYNLFVEKHNKCIVKPNGGTCGQGIGVIDLDGVSGEALKAICVERNAVAEELIKQNDSLFELGPSSVNTLRIGTIYGKVFGAVMRMGISGKCTDNFSNGGMIAKVDIKSGKITTIGYTQDCDEYTVHPDTGVVIPGYQIPYWEECKKLTEEMSQKIDGIPFIGWDIAVGNDGPIFVEANEASEISVFQLTQQKGLRQEVREFIFKNSDGVSDLI